MLNDIRPNRAREDGGQRVSALALAISAEDAGGWSGGHFEMRCRYLGDYVSKSVQDSHQILRIDERNLTSRRVGSKQVFAESAELAESLHSAGVIFENVGALRTLSLKRLDRYGARDSLPKKSQL